MVRGSVVWVTLDPTRGAEIQKTRPCVVVSRDIASELSRTITVVPLSSVKGKAPERLVQPILTTKESGLHKDSRALCDQVRTVDKGRVSRTIGVLDRAIMQKLDRGLILHLQLEGYFGEQTLT